MNFFNLTFGFPAFSLFPHPSSPPFPSPFYLYFYKDKNKEKGVNCAKAPYRRDMGEMGGNAPTQQMTHSVTYCCVGGRGAGGGGRNGRGPDSPVFVTVRRFFFFLLFFILKYKAK